MNFTGLIIAAFVIATIGVGFVWVIKIEYHVGAQIAPWIGIVGAMCVVISALVSTFWASALLGVVGGTIVWGATELPEQARRVQAGMFPKKGKRDR